jgi:hypothetical protein
MNAEILCVRCVRFLDRTEIEILDCSTIKALKKIIHLNQSLQLMIDFSNLHVAKLNISSSSVHNREADYSNRCLFGR